MATKEKINYLFSKAKEIAKEFNEDVYINCKAGECPDCSCETILHYHVYPDGTVKREESCVGCGKYTAEAVDFQFFDTVKWEDPLYARSAETKEKIDFVRQMLSEIDNRYRKYPYLDRIADKWAVVLPIVEWGELEDKEEWDIEESGNAYLFLSDTKEKAWERFLEDYIRNRDRYVDLFRKMFADVDWGFYRQKVETLDREAVQLLKAKDGGKIREMIEEILPYEEREKAGAVEEEAFRKLVEDGYWSFHTENGIVVAAWERIEDGNNLNLVVNREVLSENSIGNYPDVIWLLDTAAYSNGDIPKEKYKEIIEKVEDDFNWICTFAGLPSNTMESWDEFIKNLNTYRYARLSEWKGGYLGEVRHYDVIDSDEGSVGRHIVQDLSNFIFIRKRIPEGAPAYVISFPKEPDNPENTTYVALDGMIFTSREEARKYFEQAVREGRITYKDFYNDFLRRGYSEREAEELARKKCSECAEIRKIVTHVPPRHVDDTLAVALLSQKYPNAEIEFLHPQDDREKIEEYRKDPSVILVDVGGDYSPKLKNYDHHQSTDIPFSLRLVLENEFPQYLSVIESDPLLKRELDYFDVRDRFGFKKASEEYPDVKTSLLQETILLSLAKEGSEELKMLGKAFTEILERKLKEREVVENPEVKEVNGFKVAFDPIGVRSSEIFNRHKGIDMLIQVNSMNPNHTSVLRNSYSPNAEKIDLSRIENASFVHPAGFLAVIPKPYEEVRKDAERIVEKVTEIEREYDRGMEI